MKSQIPLLICAVVGIFMVIQYFIPATRPIYNRINDYLQIVTAFSMILGLASVIQRHMHRTQRRGKEHKRHKDWPYSALALIALVVMLLAGFIQGRGEGTLYEDLFMSILLPVQATMFSMLAFYLASAAFRAFRTRSIDATILLVAAVIVMVGRLDDGATLRLPQLAQWILNWPNLVAKRAIVLGVGLGMTATALKVVLGIERSWLGSGKE